MRHTHGHGVHTPLTMLRHKDCKLYPKYWEHQGLSKESLPPSPGQGQIIPENIWILAQWPLWGVMHFLYFPIRLKKGIVALFSLFLQPSIKPNFRFKIINIWTAYSAFFQSFYLQLPPWSSLLHICGMATRGRGVTCGRSWGLQLWRKNICLKSDSTASGDFRKMLLPLLGLCLLIWEIRLNHACSWCSMESAQLYA